MKGNYSLLEVHDELQNLRSLSSSESTGGFLKRLFSSKAKGEPAPLSVSEPLLGCFVGRYQIGRLIGQGNYGAVFELSSPEQATEYELAVKVLPKPKTPEPGSAETELFHREVAIGVKLDHRNIVKTWERFETDTARFVIMERVGGQSFDDLLQGVWPSEVVLERFGPLFEALGYAHQQGVVHRDMKPENVMLTEASVVKILDFGLAQLQGSTQITVTGEFKGTPMYSSPEQIKSSRQIAPACDQFSLGLMVFQALTGSFPYPQDHKVPLHTLFLRLQQPAARLRTANDACSEQTELVVARMLEMEPENRYPSLEEAWVALESSLL